MRFYCILNFFYKWSDFYIYQWEEEEESWQNYSIEASLSLEAHHRNAAAADTISVPVSSDGKQAHDVDLAIMSAETILTNGRKSKGRKTSKAQKNKQQEFVRVRREKSGKVTISTSRDETRHTLY